MWVKNNGKSVKKHRMTTRHTKNNVKPVKKRRVGGVSDMTRVEHVLGNTLTRNARMVSLSDTQRTRMRECLVTYMEYRPIRTTTPAPESALRTVCATFGHVFPLRLTHLSGAALVALLLIGSTTGASFAAGDALPGETLYHVKIEVNERLEGMFARSPEARASWESARIARRLQEVGTLVQQGRLGTELGDTARTLLKKHAEQALASVATLESTDPVRAARISGKMADMLSANETALARAVATTADTEDDMTTQGVLRDVQHVTQQAEKVTERADAAVTASLDAENASTIGVGGSPEVLTIPTSTITTATETGAETPATSTANTPDMTVNDADIKSSNLRIRGVHESHAHAIALRAEAYNAHALIIEKDERDAMKALLEKADAHFVNGDAARETYDYSESYRAYRAAARLFQDILAAIETSEVFAVPLTTDDIESDSRHTDNYSNTEEVDEDISAEDAIAVSQEALRTLNTFSEALKRVTTQFTEKTEGLSVLQKKEQSLRGRVLRANAALVSGEYETSTHYFSRIATQSADAYTTLLQDVIPGIVSDTHAEDIANTFPLDKQPLTLTRTRNASTTTYSGTIARDMLCDTITSEMQALHDTSHMYTLVITTAYNRNAEEEEKEEEKEKTGNVTQEASCSVIAPQMQAFPFEGTVEDPAATLSAVKIDGIEVPWVIHAPEQKVEGL
jgi:hypothetical protein